MKLDQKLVDAALDQLRRRWPTDVPGGAEPVFFPPCGICQERLPLAFP
ncbi:hypothetical protein [Streptomyces sp. NPDC050504]